MVHNRMLPRPQRHLNDIECCRSAQRTPLGIRSAGGGGARRKPGKSRGRSEGGGDISSTDGGSIGGHVVPLPSATVTVVPVWEYVYHGMFGEGDAVPDGLHPGDR